MKPQAGNPYIAGSPLRESYGFFGRQDILDWVSAELHNAHTNTLVLYGQRRVGKTTILLQLQNYLPKEKFFSIYFDLQDQAKKTLGEVLADLVDELGNRINLPKYNSNDFDNKGDFFRSVVIPDLYNVLDQGCRPVFLFDEFDVLDQVDEGHLDSIIASKALFPFLRKVINDDSRTAFVFVIGRRPEDLKTTIHQIFKAALTKEIWVLDRISAENLIKQSEVNGTLKFTQPAINRILQLTSNHAYLTQLLCQRLWQQAYQNKPSTIPIIDIEEVNFGIQDALNAGEQALVWIWDGLGPAEKIYATALAEISNENEPIPEDQVIQVLAEHAARLRLREVEQAPQDLVKRHVLVLTDNRKYIFAVEIFRRWVKQKCSLREVIDEIDNLYPTAQKLFMVGQDYYYQQKWDDAKRIFREALQNNPNHFRANLLLGETLLSTGEIEEAIHQLEVAYALDKYEAQFPFARGLISFAKAKEKEGLDEEALKASEKALEISPNERQAKDIIIKILNRQGDSKLKQGNLEEALALFEKAGSKEKADQIKIDLQVQKLGKLENDAVAFFEQKAWKRAISAYKELIEKAPDQANKEKWETALQSCEKEEKLEDLFTLGLGSLTSGDYEQAKTALKEAINIRPEYAKDGKTAISLLQQAVERRKPVTISSRWGFRIILTIIILITFFWGFSPSSPLFPILFPVTPTTYLIITNAISETSIPTSTATEILTTTSTLEFTNTTTPTSTIASFTTPEPFRNNIPLLTFDRNTSISGICWFNETNSISELSASGGFSRRTDGNWRFGIEAGRTTDEYIQTDFNQCFGQNGVGAIAFNAWIARLELERNSPDIPGEIVPGKEFGFFIENSENQRREYTVWVDKNDNMHLRVRENSEIISDDIILIVTPESLRISGAFPRLYSEFPIQFFFEINNQGLDILYLIQGPGQLEVRAESLNSNNMIRIDNSVKPTLGNIHKIGLIGYGGETQVILFPIVFFEGTADIVTPNPPTPLPTIRPTITITANPNFTPTPTETTLGFGYINKGFVSIWAEPNAGLLGSLTLNHPLTLLELKEVAGSNWYRCRWELDANIQEGWILGSNITFGLPPTPRP